MQTKHEKAQNNEVKKFLDYTPFNSDSNDTWSIAIASVASGSKHIIFKGKTDLCNEAAIIALEKGAESVSIVEDKNVRLEAILKR